MKKILPYAVFIAMIILVFVSCKKEEIKPSVYIKSGFTETDLFVAIKPLLDKLVYHENYLDFNFYQETLDITVTIEEYDHPNYFSNAGLIYVGDVNIGEQINMRYEEHIDSLYLLDIEVHKPDGGGDYMIAVYE